MTHASLFSGIGGPEVAAAMLGWENLFHCEINPFGAAVLNYWFPDSKSYADITKTDFREWRGKVDVLTGGFPCQPFSYAGKRGGRDDERYLWPEMLRAIDEIRPSWVVGENVAGLATMVEGGVCAKVGECSTLFGEDDTLSEYSLRETFTIERICRDFEHLGYAVQPVLIPAAAVGAPHRRDRIFILAYAPDTDHDRTKRRAGEDESKGREERIQERHEVQQPLVADNVRSETRQTSSDTVCRRSGTLSPEVYSGESNGNESLCDGRRRYASDTILTRLERKDEPWGGKSRKRVQVWRNTPRFDCQDLHPDQRWANFPTVPPVHRGNDGLPFSLDDLTISATKWRTESLKAYGNAIVPQVMYRIFQAIEETEKR